MAEQNNEPQTARELDQLQQETAIASRIAEKQAQKPVETTRTTNQNSDNSENYSEPEQEINLSSSKSEQQNKPGPTEQLASAGLDIAKQQLKKRFWLWVLSTVGGFLISTAWIWLPLLFILFLVGIPYYYWSNHKWSPSLYWNTFTGNYEQLFMDAINDNPSPTYQTTLTPITTDTAKPATPAANVAPDTTAQ